MQLQLRIQDSTVGVAAVFADAPCFDLDLKHSVAKGGAQVTGASEEFSVSPYRSTNTAFKPPDSPKTQPLKLSLLPSVARPKLQPFS